MTEKASTDHNDQQSMGAVPRDDGIVKHKINGGLHAWMNVVALFCVFVNTWLVDNWMQV